MLRQRATLGTFHPFMAGNGPHTGATIIQSRDAGVINK